MITPIQVSSQLWVWGEEAAMRKDTMETTSKIWCIKLRGGYMAALNYYNLVITIICMCIVLIHILPGIINFH